MTGWPEYPRPVQVRRFAQHSLLSGKNFSKKIRSQRVFLRSSREYYHGKQAEVLPSLPSFGLSQER
jgi:hypothetical protein